MRKFECHVRFGVNQGFIQANEILGVSDKFIVFNPDQSEDGRVNHKMQLINYSFLKDKNTGEVFSFNELEEPFEIIDQNGNVIIDSSNLKSDIVEAFLQILESGYELKRDSSICN